MKMRFISSGQHVETRYIASLLHKELVKVVLVPGGGLGLCSEGIYSLATAGCRLIKN